MEVFQNTKVDWLSSWLLLQTNSAICSFEVQYLYWKTCHHMLEKISSMRQIGSFCYMEHWNSHSFKKKYLQKANSTMMSPIGETTKLSTECILVSMSSSFRFKFQVRATLVLCNILQEPLFLLLKWFGACSCCIFQKKNYY